MMKVRRKNRKSSYAERSRNGVTIEQIYATAQKIISEHVDKTQIVHYYRPDIADVTLLLMKELGLTVRHAEYERAIQSALDEEEAILILI